MLRSNEIRGLVKPLIKSQLLYLAELKAHGPVMCLPAPYVKKIFEKKMVEMGQSSTDYLNALIDSLDDSPLKSRLESFYFCCKL